MAFSIVLIALTGMVFVEAFTKWFQLLRIKERILDRHGEWVLLDAEE